jgi:hypothetical protein
LRATGASCLFRRLRHSNHNTRIRNKGTPPAFCIPSLMLMRMQPSG